MSQATPSASQTGTVSQAANHVSPSGEAVRILSLRRVELAHFARHLDRLKRRQQEQQEHLAHTRRQVDGLLDRGRQQIAHIQSTSPERIVELEKALALAQSEVGRAAKSPELEKALLQARNDVEAQRRETARLAGDKAKLGQELETLRSEVARMAAEKTQAVNKARQLEQTLAAAQQELQTTRRQIEQLQESASRIAELEEVLTAAAAELEAREKQIAELTSAAPAPAAGPNLEQIVAEVRAEVEDFYQADIQRLNLDVDALRKGNVKLRHELEQAQGGAAPAGDAALAKENEELKTLLTDLEKHAASADTHAGRLAALETQVQQLTAENQQLRSQPQTDPENQELKTRLATVEESVRQLVEENTKFRGLSAELEQERDSALETLEREAAIYNQQRRDLEEEVRALRKKLESGVQTRAPAPVIEPARPVAAQAELDLVAEMMAGEIVPEPDADVELEEPPIDVTQTPLSAVNLDDGFDFPHGEADLVGVHRLIENDHRLLALEISDPTARHEDRQPVDLEEQKILVDGLLDQVRRAREALLGRPVSPPVVVAPKQPQLQKPRNALQGLQRWIKGRK